MPCPACRQHKRTMPHTCWRAFVLAFVWLLRCDRRVALHEFIEIWWRIRGVGPRDYRTLCRRCRRTGQTHWSLRGCVRFRA